MKEGDIVKVGSLHSSDGFYQHLVGQTVTLIGDEGQDYLVEDVRGDQWFIDRKDALPLEPTTNKTALSYLQPLKEE